jgi:predicted DNA-binding transcriptional regulator AlpA
MPNLPSDGRDDAAKDPIDRITLVRLREVARALGRSTETIRDWVREGRFPRPLVARPGAPLQWRIGVVEAWIERQSRSRHLKPKPRGKLRQGGV